MKARYALEKRIAGFDFFPWLVCQVAAGATEIVIDTRKAKTDKFTTEEVKRRTESILLPGPALMGLPCRYGTDGEELALGHQQDLVALARSGPIPRLKSVLPPGKERYTVTIRETRRWPNRNSNPAWRTFAEEIGARVIEDYDSEPMHLHEKMALYAGAEMNFFVTNGPVMLCFLSEYPAMGFDVQKSPMINVGVPMGAPYPFLLPQHRQIYEPDDLGVIRRHFKEWRAGR